MRSSLQAGQTREGYILPLDKLFNLCYTGAMIKDIYELTLMPFKLLFGTMKLFGQVGLIIGVGIGGVWGVFAVMSLGAKAIPGSIALLVLLALLL